jgi:hypothetical protein
LNGEWNCPIACRGQPANLGYRVGQVCLSNGDGSVLNPTRVAAVEDMAAQHGSVRADPGQIPTRRLSDNITLISEGKVVRIKDQPAAASDARADQLERSSRLQ